MSLSSIACCCVETADESPPLFNKQRDSDREQKRRDTNGKGEAYNIWFKERYKYRSKRECIGVGFKLQRS